MKKDEIVDSLFEFDKFTIGVLTTSILEFQETFGNKYLTTEEILKLVKENVPNGIKLYDDLGDTFDAICSLKHKEFKVNRNVLKDKDYFDYVFFHEFIHSISFRTYDGIKYMGFYSADKDEDYGFKSKAFNEAFTEYLTLKRNEKLNYKIENGSLSGYDLGATEIILLCDAVGEESLIDLYFNKPYELGNFLKKHNMNIEEVLYSIYVFESMDLEIYNLTNKHGMKDVNNLVRIIDAERYLFYNLSESFGNIKNEEEFNNKWGFLLSETNLKYNFWNIDGVIRYGELLNDISRLKIGNNKIVKKLSKELLDKYSLLDSIFKSDDENEMLKKFNKIYTEDYKKYYNLVKDDFSILPYIFLDKIKNNYQLYDIEIYPRVYPYLKLEKATIKDVDFKKIECSEKSTKIFIFNINGNNYVECNYDDTIINKKSNNIFEFVYDNQVDVLNLENITYKSGNQIYKCTNIY